MSQIYRDLFKSQFVVDPTFDREELLANLKHRQEHKIPPGYKDASNEHSGIGDLLIWKTLLEIGKTEERHLVFVSGDEKSDWRYQSESQALYPRCELLGEYRRASKGKSLLIITFAQLLEQFGAPAPVVARVKQEEAAVSLLSGPSAAEVKHEAARAEQAVFRWLTREYAHAQVEAQLGFPDIVVRTGDRVEGYEVKYLRSVTTDSTLCPPDPNAPQFPQRPKPRTGTPRQRRFRCRCRSACPSAPWTERHRQERRDGNPQRRRPIHAPMGR